MKLTYNRTIIWALTALEVFALLLLTGCSIDDAAMADVYELVAKENEFFVPATGGEAAIQVYSNGKVSVEELTAGGTWRTIDKMGFAGDQIVTVSLDKNEAFRRMVKLRFVLEGGIAADTVWVKQYGVIPTLECPAPYRAIDGSTETHTEFEINTNIPFGDFEIATSYTGKPDGWVKSVQSEQGLVVVDARPNASDNTCKAIVRLSYLDGWEETFAVNLYITQSDKDNEFGRDISFADARAMATSGGAPITDDLIIEGVVISDYRSRNMELNPAVAHDRVDVSVNDCTAYLQSMDGKYGFRLRFDSPENNVLMQGTRISLSLNGTVLTREEDPARYTISGLVGENMVESEAGQIIPVKNRMISDLTDDDIYTFVSLQNTEFLSKDGAYTNVDENYTLASELTSEVTGNSNRMDGWASMLIDRDGGAIYAPVNMLCLWRRTGMGVPQGTGQTHGVVVHNELQRYGNVGRYQIRVLNEGGFDMDWAGSSSYTTLAEWNGYNYHYTYGTYAGFNPRYAYNRLQTITPSDDISEHNTTPAAELFCENHTEPAATTNWPIAGAKNFNNPAVKTRGYGVARDGNENRAYQVHTDVKGWYKWEDGRVSGYNGLRAEFSTAGLSGQRMLAGFTFAAGNLSAATSKTYPAHWCVEYSIDGGASYAKCKSAVDNGDYVHLRTLPWWDASLAGNRYNTCSSAGLGVTEHVFVLPAEVFGKDKVIVRICPYDEVMTVLPLAWDGNTETAEVSASTTHDNYIRWGTITLRY